MTPHRKRPHRGTGDATPEPTTESPTQEAIDDVAAEAMASVLQGQPYLTRDEVAERAGVPLPVARRFWRALGFPNVGDDTSAFTDADVAALSAAYEVVAAGEVEWEAALALVRALGRSMDRMASWQLQVLAEADPGDDPVPELLGRVEALAKRTEPLLEYAWRRHMAGHLRNRVASSLLADDAARSQFSVGFADLVSFTRTVRVMSEKDLASLVQRFEATTSDIASSHGGRVIKTVGDEVLFVARNMTSAGAIALDIAEEIVPDHAYPEVRVGIASGPVVERLGDVYGPTVNLASRLRSVAYPGSVLVDESTATVLNARSGFNVRKLSRRSLRGIGRVAPWVLTRRTTRR